MGNADRDPTPDELQRMIDLVRRGMKDGEYMLGIDEDTALVGSLGGEWTVMGASTVHLITRKDETVYPAGDVVPLPM